MSINLAVCVMTSLSALEAVVDGFWSFQRVAVFGILALAAAWTILLQPTSDRLFGWLLACLYTLHALAAFFTFASHELRALGFDAGRSRRTSDALVTASLWVPLSLVGYDVLAPALQRVRKYGCSVEVLWGGGAAWLDGLRALLATLTVSSWW